MFKFFTYTFAVLGFLVVLLVGGLIGLGIHQSHKNKEANNIILSLDLSRAIVEQNDESPIARALQDSDTLSLLDVVTALDRAKNDPHVKGLVVRFSSAQPELAQLQEIRDAIARFRSGGKLTYAFGTSFGDFGLSNRAYYLASSFENIWLQPVGSVGLTGLAVQSPFFKGTLDKMEVKADFLQREEYKSVMEMAMRDDFSPPVRANMQDLLNDLTTQIAGGIAESRQWKSDKVRQLMAAGPFTSSEALKEGLVTRLGYWDELETELRAKAGNDSQQVSISKYNSYFSHHLRVKPADKKIAIIYGLGLITENPSRTDSLSGEHAMSARKIAEAFDQALRDKHVNGILFRIDSPGGSPDASETIRRAVVHAKNLGKPVYVSMGGVAASGGYWVAMNADRIVAEPGTLTGSIGVVAGKFVVGGLIKKLGANWSILASDPSSEMWTPAQEFTPFQRARVDALLDETYHAFIAGVSEGRHIPIEKMPDIAKGRVWTGEQALSLGLVDELGGLTTTLAALKVKIGLKDTDDVALEIYPRPLTPAEKILKLLKDMDIESASLGSFLTAWSDVRGTLGPILAASSNQGKVMVRADDLVTGVAP